MNTKFSRLKMRFPKYFIKRVLPVILVALVYVLPNLLQDIHRLTGHSERVYYSSSSEYSSLHPQSEKCPVCVFEFYSGEETRESVFPKVYRSFSINISAIFSQQISDRFFQYFKLRAPPVI